MLTWKITPMSLHNHHQPQLLIESTTLSSRSDIETLQTKRCFFHSSNVRFLVTLWKFIVSVTCTIWKEWHLLWSLWHYSQSGSRFNMLCILRCSSTYFGWNRYVFDLMFLSYVLEAVVHCCNVQHHQHIFTQRIAAHWIFLSFWKILFKSQSWQCKKTWH